MARSLALLSPAEARRVSAFADVDPRTIATYLDGTRATYPRTAAAIERALRRIKRGDLVRATHTSAAA